MSKHTLIALAVGTILSSHAHPASAQETPASVDSGDVSTASPMEDAQADTLDRVVVTATRGSKAIDRIPGAVSVVTRREIDEQLVVSEDLSQVLATQVPGYAPSRQKMTSFGESMRGRVPLILFDGVPQTNPLRSGAREGYFADPSVIERIEVVSGASAVQGLGATGGIINYISRTPRTEGTRHTVDAKFGTQFRSDDQLWKAGYMLEHARDRFDALLYLGATTRGVGVDGDGRRLGIEGTQGDTQDSTSTDVFVKLGFALTENQRLQLSANRYELEGDGDWTRVLGNRAAGVPTSARRGEPLGAAPRNEVRTLSVDWSHADLGGGTASVQVYKQDFSATYGAGYFANFQDPAIAPAGTLLDQSEVVADKAGMRTSWVRPDLWTNGLELTIGLDWLSDKSRQQLALTGRTWVPELDFSSYAPFAQLEYEAGPFTVRGGVRREHASLAVDTYRTLATYGSREVQGGERSFTQWVESLGVVWRFADGWSVFAAYNEGFGLPDVGLVLRAVNRDGQSFEDLVDLKPIVTDNREIGITWAGRLGSFTASAYDSRSELGSQVRVTNGIGSVARVPIRVKGFEFAGELRPHADWTLTATYASTRGRTAIAEGAPLDVSLGARSQGPDKFVAAARWAVTPGLALRLQAQHYASRDINEGRFAGAARLEEHFDGYTLADLAATWATRWGDFGLGIENVFDRQYVGYFPQANPGGTNEDYFAGHGRTYTLSWKRSFE
jgi:iron complex outermembrane receptor protein